jgi:beta-N-acetylhexosaminidase
VLNHKISIEIINERVKRVLKYKEELNPIDFNKTYDSVQSIVENKETKEFSYNVVKNALTLVKGKVLKLKKNALFIGVLPVATTIADETDGQHSIIKQIKKDIPSLTTMTLPVQPSPENIQEIVKAANQYQQVVLCTYNANIYQSQIELINQLSDMKIELHVISMRNPYDLHYAKHIENYVCIYEYTPNSVRALLEYLRGELLPKGKIPVAYE